MRKTAKLLFAFFLSGMLVSCLKEGNNYYTSTYRSDKGTYISFTDIDWYLTKNNIGGGDVNLRLTGSTNGDSATVRTYGDGLTSDEKMNLDAKKEFNQDFRVSFTSNFIPDTAFIAQTVLFVYRGTDTLKVLMVSDYLKY